MRILVVQNSTVSPVGLVGNAVLELGWGLETTMPAFGCAMPENPEDYAGLIILGGEMGAADDAHYPHFQPLMNLIRAFAEAQRPVMGLCLGAQLIARSFGSAVYRHTHVEFGYMTQIRTAPGRADGLLGALENDPVCLQFHEDTFDLPSGAVLLATGEGCRNQAFRINENVYGFQFHLEATDTTARSWATLPEAGRATQGDCAIAMIERDLTANYAASRTTARVVTERWLRLV